MLFGFWQFKITVSILLLTSCLSQELFQTCDRDYCYERSIERRNIQEDHLREWQAGERLHDDTERIRKFRQEYTDNRHGGIKEVRENRVDISDFEFHRLNSRRESAEIFHELDNLTSNSIRSEHRALIDGNNAITDEIRRSVSSRMSVDKRDNYRNVERLVDETRRIRHLDERTLGGTQNSVGNEREDRSVTSRRSNDRENQQVDIRESLPFNDRLAETRHDFKQREVNEVNRESHRLIKRATDENLKQEERSSRRQDLTRIEVENQRENRNDRRLSNDRVSENTGRFELSERDEFGRLRLSEHERLTEKEENRQERDNRLERNHGSRRSVQLSESKREHPLNERDQLTKNRRFIETSSEERNRGERDTRLERNHESRETNNRISETEHLSKKRESLRQLSERENTRSSEWLSQTDLKKETITRIEAENQRDNINKLGLSQKRFAENERRFESLKHDEFRRLPLRESAALNKNERRLKERDQLTKNRRFIVTSSEERNREERDRRLERNHESRHSNDRIYETEHLPEKRASLRQFSDRENTRSSERLSQTDLEKEAIIRTEAENQRDNINKIGLSQKRFSENERRFENLEHDEFRRLPLRESATLNKNERRLIASSSEERNRHERDTRLERNHESRESNNRISETERLPEESKNLRQISERENQRSTERVSQEVFENQSHSDTSRRIIERGSLNQRIEKHYQTITQLRNNNEQEREESDRRETFRQLAYSDNRYDISRHLNEKEKVFTLRRSENMREYPDNREPISESDSETKQRELKDRQHAISSAINDSLERRYENLRERERVLNRNYESRRVNSRQAELEKEKLQTRNEILRNTRAHLDRNEESRDILIDENTWSRRSKMVHETAERRNENVRKPDQRREELRQFEKRERDESRSFNENLDSRRIDEWHFENIENVQMRKENRDAHRHNNRQESIRNNEPNVRQDDERLNQRLNTMRQDKNLDYKDFHYMVDEYVEKPTVFINRGFMTLGQGALLAYIIMKTVNGKHDIKYNIYQNLQKAIALMGY